MNSFDSWEVAIDLGPQARTWKEECWRLLIRNSEKEVCEWTSQNDLDLKIWYIRASLFRACFLH